MRLTAAGRAGHDEVDEHRVQRPEVDRDVDEAQLDRRRRGPAFWVATHHSPSEIATVTTSLVRARSPSERRLTIFV